MRHYLDQIGCVLRPRSVGNTLVALPSFGTYLRADGGDVSVED